MSLQAKTESGDFARINYTPTANTASGTVVVLGTIVGFTTRDIAANDLGSLATYGGVASVVKADETIADGVKVYWDADGDPYGGTAGSGALTATASNGVYMGNTVGATATGNAYCSILTIGPGQ